ncbi:hypothetical protein ROZALSC1DRAFT_6338, partial [Rozella allomycis CSF55]
MALDELRSTKAEPRYTGPFTLIRRNKAGTYILKGPDGTEYKRPPSSLKLFYQPAINQGEVAEVQNIVDHAICNETNENLYLVKWKKLTAAHNQWVKESDFNDLAPIQKFWKEKKQHESINQTD